MKAYFVISTLLISFVGKAQYAPVGAITMWTDGYVVTTQHDTIRGQVRVGSLVNDSPVGIVVRTGDNAKPALPVRATILSDQSRNLFSRYVLRYYQTACERSGL